MDILGSGLGASSSKPLSLVFEHMFEKCEGMTALASLEAPVTTGLLDDAALASMVGSLDRVDAAELAVLLRRLDTSINQLQSVRLKTVAAAAKLRAGADVGLANTGAWMARESRIGGAEASRSVQLASALGALPRTGDALAGGSISVQHAEVIATAAKNFPTDLTAAERARVESALIEQAESVDPATLRKVSRRAVEIAGRSVVEADEAENQIVRTVKRSRC